MNPMILLPLLAAACVAAPAPAGFHHQSALTYAQAPALAYTTQVQVPLTKTVHYESRPVVTGYSTSIIKPAIAAHTVASPILSGVVAAPIQAAPAVVVTGDYLTYEKADPPTNPQQPAPPSLPTQPALPSQPAPPALPSQPGAPTLPSGQPTPPPGVCLLPGSQQPPGQMIPPCPTQPPTQPGQPIFQFPQIPAYPTNPPPAGQPGAGAGESGNSQSNPPQEPGSQFPTFPGGLPAFPIFPPQQQLIQGIHLIPEQQPIAAAPEVVAVQPAPAAPAATAAPVQEIQEPQQVAIQSDDTEVIENPEFRSAAPVQTLQAANLNTVQLGGFGGFGLNLAAPAAVATYAAAPAAVATYAAAPAAYATYAAAPAPVILKAAAPSFDELVTKEKVLAPVRTHTQITPQVTQIQPEVTVRKVIHDVPVATPVGYAAPAIHTYAAQGFGLNTINAGYAGLPVQNVW